VAGEIDYTPTEDDYVEANRDWNRSRFRRRFPRLMIVATLTCYGVISLLQGDIASWSTLGASVAVGLLAVPVGFLIEIKWVMPIRARRLFRQHRALHRDYHYRWSDEELAYHSANGEGRVAWGDLYRWHEGRNVFLFCLNARLFFYLPRRALSDAQIVDLRETAAAFGPPRL
jgi:hypothetical protein